MKKPLPLLIALIFLSFRSVAQIPNYSKPADWFYGQLNGTEIILPTTGNLIKLMYCSYQEFNNILQKQKFDNENRLWNSDGYYQIDKKPGFVTIAIVCKSYVGNYFSPFLDDVKNDFISSSPDGSERYLGFKDGEQVYCFGHKKEGEIEWVMLFKLEN